MPASPYLDFDGLVVNTAGYAMNYNTPQPAAGVWVNGTSTSDVLKDIAGGDTLAGGGGDDTYQIVDTSTKIVETATGGVDKVITWTNYVLPQNVEVLDLKSDNTTGVANSQGSLLISEGQRTTLVSGAGKDVMVDSGLGHMTFSFSKGGGDDVIYGFKAGSGAMHDTIQLRDYGFTSFDEVRSHLTQSGSDTLLTLGDHQAVLLRGVNASDLVADDFRLQLDTSKLHLTFDDEFNSLSLYNSTTNQGTWKTVFNAGPENGGGSLYAHSNPGTGEVQAYVDPLAKGLGTVASGLNPFSIDNGVLGITASRMPDAYKSAFYGLNYQSGLLTSEKSLAQTYGYFEIKAEMPSQNGMFPAFWLLRSNMVWPPELDVFEHVNNDDTIFQGYGSTDTSVDPHSNISYVAGSSTGYHTYGLLWTPERLSWYVDGVQTGSIRTPADMNQPMYMIVNLAVGSNWSGPTDANFVSDTLHVDYIRAYSLADSPVTSSAGSTTNTTSTPPVADPVSAAPVQSDPTPPAADPVPAPAQSDPAPPVDTTPPPSSDPGLILTGNSGANVLTGGLGDDTLNGGKGVDTMTGGAGDDSYYVDSANDKVVELVGGGKDTIYAGSTFRLPDNVENITLLYTGGSTAVGNSLDNLMTGNSGANRLVGGLGADTLLGGDGADTLEGGYGDDVLTGGGGADRFVFARWGGHDVVTDFGSGDTLDLSALYGAGAHATLAAAGADTMITLTTGDSISLTGVSMAHVQATTSGFIFH